MARKKKAQEEFEELMDAPPSPERRRQRPSPGAVFRFALMTCGLVLGVFAVGWMLWQTDQFLADDPRFQIAELERGEPDTAIAIDGVHKASIETVQAVFAQDRGRSLYRLDPDERRRSLQQVEWVKDATVRRVWPNRVSVEIEERTPLAFIQVPFRASGPDDSPVSYRPMLVDEDGVILRVRGDVPSDLPLLNGVQPSDAPEVRRERVKLMRRVLEDLREVKSSIVEIDVSREESLSVAYQMHDQIYTLVLGGSKFRERVERFVNGYPEWKDRLPPRAIVDLTHETRIVVRPVETASK